MTTSHCKAKKWYYPVILLGLMGSLAQANVLGVNIQQFNPTPDGKDFVTVHSPGVLAENGWAYSFYINHAVNNLLIYDLPLEDQKKIERKDYLTGGDFNLAYGISNQLEFGFSVPAVLSQDVDDQQLRKVFVTSGPVEIRTQIKYLLTESPKEAQVALLASVDMPNVKNDPYMGLAAKPVLNLEMAYGQNWGPRAWAFNLGYRLREPGERPANSPMYPLDDQFIYSAAYSQYFGQQKSMKWVAEFFGSLPANSKPYKKASDISSAELLLAVKGRWNSSMGYAAGAGVEALPESLAPDYRVFLGLEFNMGTQDPFNEILVDEKIQHESSDADLMPVYRDDLDLDGVSDSRDMCPETPKGVAVDTQGCGQDRDLDGVADYEDKCPSSLPGQVVDGKGCAAIKDIDFDGVPDHLDKCPNTSSEVKVNAQGCPVKKNRR